MNLYLKIIITICFVYQCFELKSQLSKQQSFSGNTIGDRSECSKPNEEKDRFFFDKEKLILDKRSFFEADDRVCFIGNSITQNGEFHHNIMEFYVTRYPEKKIRFYNCGISGDMTSGILDRMDSDVLKLNPTHAIIMVGMNDVLRNLYEAYPVCSSDTLKRREMALINYKQSLDSIIRLLLSNKIKVILQKPTIYDENAQILSENKLGVNAVLLRCSNYVQELADKYHLITIDYWNIMMDINRRMQKSDTKSTIVGADRIHPGSKGHFVMSYQFLTTVNTPKYVAYISIDKKYKSLNNNSLNCEINKIKYNKNEVSFYCKERALPYPIVKTQKEILDYVPFISSLDLEILQVNDLVEGKYQIYIDKTPIGIYSNRELETGVNLSLIENTPQYKQSLIVHEVLSKLWINESKLRGIKHLEFQHLKNFPKNNLELCLSYLDSIFSNKFPDIPYLKLQLNNYKINKPLENKLTFESDSLREVAYKFAQTKGHFFYIKRHL